MGGGRRGRAGRECQTGDGGQRADRQIAYPHADVPSMIERRCGFEALTSRHMEPESEPQGNENFQKNSFCDGKVL
jgi:hypothetical protein